MRILRHTPGEYLELGAEVEPERSDPGCFSGCSAGCLTPLALALLLLLLGREEIGGWFFGIWGALTLVALIFSGWISDTSDECTRLELDRRGGALRWSLRSRRRTRREFEIPLGDIRAIELEADVVDGSRLLVDLEVTAREVPAEADPGPPWAVNALIRTLVHAIALWPASRDRGESDRRMERRTEHPPPGIDEDDSEEHDSGVSITLAVDWLQPPEILALGDEIAAILGFAHRREAGREGEHRWVWSRERGESRATGKATSGWTIAEEPFVALPAAIAEPPESPEARNAGVTRDGTGIRIGATGSGIVRTIALGLLALLGSERFLAVFDRELSLAQELLGSAIIAIVLGIAISLWREDAIRQVRLLAAEREVVVRARSRRLRFPFAEAERVVRIAGKQGGIVIDTVRGSVPLPIDCDLVDEPTRDRLALELGAMLGRPALLYRPPVRSRRTDAD